MSVKEYLKEFTDDQGVLAPEVAHVVSEFERCSGWIGGALEYCQGSYQLEDILIGILRKDYQLWPSPNSVIITEVVEFPRKKMMSYFLAGGDGDEIRTTLWSLEKRAKEIGCSYVTLTGRKGWSRSLAKQGYVTDAVVLFKELN